MAAEVLAVVVEVSALLEAVPNAMGRVRVIAKVNNLVAKTLA